MENITLPDQLMASGDLLNGFVTDMKAEPSKGQVYNVNPDTNGGMNLTTSGGSTYDLTFTIEATVTNTVKNEVGTQEVRVGKTHIVKTTQFEFEKGVILTCEQATAS